MNHRILRMFGSAATVAVLVAGGAAPALGATRHHNRAHRARAGTSATTTTGSTETALAGATLTSATSAALAAVPGGTVTRASTETDSSSSTAAYEVHVTKSDGSKVVVIEDASFAVLSTAASTGGCA